MKKVYILCASVIVLMISCGDASTPQANPDSTNVSPIDTVKIDTVKPTDSIIKG
jgi:hypothetical protein